MFLSLPSGSNNFANTLQMWHKADWDKVKKDPASIGLPREEWIHEHDSAQHAESVADDVIKKFSP